MRRLVLAFLLTVFVCAALLAMTQGCGLRTTEWGVCLVLDPNRLPVYAENE